MSTQRGNTAKKPQKFQNKTAFRNDLYDSSKRTKILNQQTVNNCCKRCKEIIEWRIKFKKYKQLVQPKKCVKCLQKAVKHSYFIVCSACTEKEHICGKCAEKMEQGVEGDDSANGEDHPDLKKLDITEKLKSDDDETGGGKASSGSNKNKKDAEKVDADDVDADDDSADECEQEGEEDDEDYESEDDEDCDEDSNCEDDRDCIADGKS